MDVDGTLIESNLLHTTAWTRAFARLGYTIDVNTLIHKIGMGGDKLPQDVLGDDATEEQLEEASHLHSEEFNEKGLIEHAEKLPGAPELLQELKRRGLKVALCTSGRRQELDLYLEHLGGQEVADAYVVKEDVSGTKPEPDLFAVGLEKLGNPTSAVVFGDTVYDIEAAGKLGLPCVCVLSGGIEREVLVEAGAARVYEHAQDIVDNLDEALSPPELTEVALGS